MAGMSRDNTRELALLVNPVSGGGRSVHVADRAVRCLEGSGRRVRVLRSGGPGELGPLARELSAGGAVVAACGGDGTFNEIVNGIGPGGGPVGIIPAGRGNDLASNLGIPHDTVMACRTILDGTGRTIDLVRAGDRLFAGVGGAGIDAEVSRRANESRLPLRGRAVYTWAVLRAFSSFRPYRFAMEADGWSYEGDVMFAGVANHPSYGGGLILSPPSRADDGVFEVCIIEKRTRLSLLLSFPRLFNGTHLDLPGVIFRKARRLRLESDRPADFYADGDRMGSLPLDVEIVPAALKVIVPRIPFYSSSRYSSKSHVDR
jgi:diacylglycerol kinase (ATP)